MDAFFEPLAEKTFKRTRGSTAGRVAWCMEEEEEEEERSLIKDLKRYAQLAVAWDRHGSLVPRWT